MKFESPIVKVPQLIKVPSMVHVLTALGLFLIGWGGYVLISGDFVATLDIAASLVASGVIVIGFGAIVRSLDAVARQIADRPVARDSVASLEARAEIAPAQTPVPRRPAAAEETSAPALVREGVIEGRQYRFYSDGSIEAEGATGLRRYRSIDEAREQILRERQDQEPGRAAGRDDFAERRPPLPQPPSSRPQARGAGWESPPPPPRGNGASDPYAPPGARPAAATPDPGPQDEEWSEPFRLLLRGEGEPGEGLPKPKR